LFKAIATRKRRYNSQSCDSLLKLWRGTPNATLHCLWTSFGYLLLTPTLLLFTQHVKTLVERIVI
jgi:hypothetical protein